MHSKPERPETVRILDNPGGRKLSRTTLALMLIAGVVVLLGVIVPTVISVRHITVWNACTYNLQRIQKAKQAWAKETGADAV